MKAFCFFGRGAHTWEAGNRTGIRMGAQRRKGDPIYAWRLFYACETAGILHPGLAEDS